MKDKRGNEEIILLDILRLILICGVITIHTGAPWYIMAIGRLAVPFTFALTGFFVNNENINVSIKRNVIRLLIWFTIYLPLIVYDAYNVGKNLIRVLQEILFMTPYYLWFLTALVTCLLLYKVTLKFSSGIKLISVIVLYTLGCIGNSYLDILHARNLYTGYLGIFLTVRNGVFFAPIFFFIGQKIKNLQEKGVRLVNIVGVSLIAFFLYFAEYWIVNYNPLVYDDASMYFMLPLLICIILYDAILLNNRINYKQYFTISGKTLRQLSTWIYLSQGFLIRILAHQICGGMKLAIPVLLISILLFLLMYKSKYGRRIIVFLTK